MCIKRPVCYMPGSMFVLLSLISCALLIPTERKLFSKFPDFLNYCRMRYQNDACQCHWDLFAYKASVLISRAGWFNVSYDSHATLVMVAGCDLAWPVFIRAKILFLSSAPNCKHLLSHWSPTKYLINSVRFTRIYEECVVRLKRMFYITWRLVLRTISPLLSRGSLQCGCSRNTHFYRQYICRFPATFEGQW